MCRTNLKSVSLTVPEVIAIAVLGGQVRSGGRIVRGPLRRSSTVTAVDSLSP